MPLGESAFTVGVCEDVGGVLEGGRGVPLGSDIGSGADDPSWAPVIQ